MAIAGLSPDQEPSPARLAELQKYVKENNISTIYFEEVASPKVAETLANETGAKLEVLSPIEGITDKEQKKAWIILLIWNKTYKPCKNNKIRKRSNEIHRYSQYWF